MTNKKEKVGLWVSLIFSALAFLGVRIPEEATPIIEKAAEAYEVEIDVVGLE